MTTLKKSFAGLLAALAATAVFAANPQLPLLNDPVDVSGALREHPPAAPVGRNFLDIEYGKAVRLEYLLHRRQRQIGKMLVVDGVELVFGEQPQQVRKLECRDTLRL